MRSLRWVVEMRAHVSRLPWRDGDGYSYGGDVILTIGRRSFACGASKDDEAFAKEVAERWNRCEPENNEPPER